ncbi:MAG: ROK family protein [Pseudomonadota bacterium]
MTQALLADVGGTYCRLAVWDGSRPAQILKVPTDPDLLTKIVGFASKRCPAPTKLVLAVAGLQTGMHVKLTNAEVSLDLSALAAAFPAADISLLNDFEAAAAALERPPAVELSFLQADQLSSGARLIVGVGTGLGVGLWTGQHALKTEGGHVAATPMSPAEREMFRSLRTRWPNVFMGEADMVEVEALVSGIGLPKVYHAYSDVEGGNAKADDAGAVMLLAQDGDSVALQAVATLSWHLGRLVGDLFVASWATGGVILTGGVLTKNMWLLNHGFWSKLHAGGRYAGHRRSVPIALWDSDDIGLLGAGLSLSH